jgi:hypothetical protein
MTVFLTVSVKELLREVGDLGFDDRISESFALCEVLMSSMIRRVRVVLLRELRY